MNPMELLRRYRLLGNDRDWTSHVRIPLQPYHWNIQKIQSFCTVLMQWRLPELIFLYRAHQSRHPLIKPLQHNPWFFIISLCEGTSNSGTLMSILMQSLTLNTSVTVSLISCSCWLTRGISKEVCNLRQKKVSTSKSLHQHNHLKRVPPFALDD